MTAPTLQVSTLASLRNQIRQRADIVNSQFITDAELTSYINSSAAELYDILVQKYGEDYFMCTTPPTIVATTALVYDRPADFYKLRGVDQQITGNQWATVRPFNFQERNRFNTPMAPVVFGITATRYRVIGTNQIMFIPQMTAGATFRIWYVPRLTPLSGDTDTMDGVSGWLEYVICDCIIKCKCKMESDCAVEMALKEALVHRIEAVAENRDSGMPMTVADTSCTSFQGVGPGLGWGSW
jgi:hypothetical protein